MVLKEIMSPREMEVFSFLMPLSVNYPHIEKWFFNKVIPGWRNGTRKILTIYRNGCLAGLGIAKNEDNEKKICTVRVSPEYENKGVGVRIFNELMEWLEDDKPHLTVNEENIIKFEKLFNHFGYDFTSSKSGIYLPDKVEIYFNEKSNKKNK